MSHKGAVFQTHPLLAMGSSAFSSETLSGSAPTAESKQAPCLLTTAQPILELCG